MVELSTPKQRQMIGYFRKLLCLDDETYYNILWSWGVESSKNLSAIEAETFINQLKKKAIGLGRYTPKSQYCFQKYKYSNLGERDSNMATASQLRKIEALWFDVSFQPDDISRKNALNTFCKRITGKERLVFLTKRDISKLIKVLENMREKQLCKA